MKKNFISVSFLFSLFFAPYSAYAAWPVFDAPQFGKQIIQLSTEIITKGATLATQINTWSLSLKFTVLDPLGNAMIAISLLKQQTNTMNLVTGALGTDQLLVSNPEQWIKNKGLGVINISLGDINKQPGLYGDSLFSNIVSSFKSSNRDLGATLNIINTSSVPGIVQKNICGDASLLQIARNDVMKSDGTFDPAELAARRQELWNSLCVGNPADPNNLQLAQRLNKVNSQRPDIGGWDSILAVSSGDNSYTKGVQATLAISKKVDETRSAAKDDLARGGGIASPRGNCAPSDRVTTAPNSDPVLNISDALCRVTTFANTGSAVNSAFQASINAPMDRLINSFGSGIIGSLSALLSARNTIGMLSNAFSGIAGSGGSGSNSATTVSASSTPVEDLRDNPDGRKIVSAPTTRRLTAYSESLDKFEAADNGIRMEVSLAQGTAGQIRTCYERLMTDFSVNEQYPGIGEAISYASSRMQSMDKLLSKTAQDAFTLAAARKLVMETQTKIDQSNSSEEISNLYEAFEEKVGDGTLPSDSAAAEREGDYQTLKGDNQVDSMEGGTAYRLQAQCTTIRQQLTPREQS